MNHSLFNKVLDIVKTHTPVLLSGPAGTGKTTIALNIAKTLNLDFYMIGFTKQTTVSNILGFLSINGVYLPSQFRQAFEHGGLVLLDEIDAGDPNTLLALNTIENGFISFPDKIVHKHPNFYLIATSNPQTDHAIYTGRSKLDFSTVDRFLLLEIPFDINLEISIIGENTHKEVAIIRETLEAYNITKPFTMRDAIRYNRLLIVNPLATLSDFISDKGIVEEIYIRLLESQPKEKIDFTTIDSLNKLDEVLTDLKAKY